MSDAAAPNWMDQTGVGVIGTFTLDDGERITGEIIDFDEEVDELVVQPISAVGSETRVELSQRTIAVSCVLSFNPEPRSPHAWPHSDPCRNSPFSGTRFALMTALFISSTAGSLILFIALMDRTHYRLQELSAISYTLSVTFLTFAAHRDAPRYMFTCPAVKPQIPRLLWRHVGFILGLFLLQTAALAIRPSLPAWWSLRDSKGRTPFEAVLLLLCCSLGFVQVFTNRSLLQRAHAEFIG